MNGPETSFSDYHKNSLCRDLTIYLYKLKVNVHVMRCKNGV